MYNPLKNKINTIFFNNFLEDSTKVLEIENKEEIFYQHNKLVVFVKDEEIGLRIYDIIKNLKSNSIKICTPNTTFKVSKFISDRENRVQAFCIDFTFNEHWKNPTKSEKLQELVKFIENMQEYGYRIDASVFEKEECNCISSLLSFFSREEQIVPFTNESLVEFIHFVLSDGKELNTSYAEIIAKGICSCDDLPYCLPVAKMCYEYFATGTYDGDIYMVLQDESLEESFGKHFYKYLMFNKTNFELTSKLVNKNSEYTIYSDNIKIYNNISFYFEKFIKNNVGKENSLEQIDGIIIDLNEKIIGYRFYNNEIPDSIKLVDKKIIEQIDVFSFISILNKYVAKIRALKHDLKLDINTTGFNIEKFVLSYKNNYGVDSFVITEINELFKLILSDEKYIKAQITSVFFKIYSKYLNENYGAMSREDEYFDTVEVRYLSPILAREFVNYALGRNTNYTVAEQELFRFLHSSKCINNTSSNAKKCLYDSNFEYDPIKVPIIFDYEVKKKYGININKKFLQDRERILSDGRRLIVFDEEIDVLEIKEQQEGSPLYRFFENFEDEHVKIVGISEIIYSKKINAKGKYTVKGYVTTPIYGQILTDEVLLGLSNKDFLKVAGYLFTKFSNKHYIPLNNIYMDDNFNFYVDILNEDFLVMMCSNHFIDQIINKLKGYSQSNPYMFVDIDEISNYSKLELLAVANSLDSYCDKHKIFYNSLKEMCPVCLRTMYPISNTVFEESQIVYKDKYAKHYRLQNSKYFIKVYNSSNVDMVELENNIDSLIMRYSYQTVAIQEAFIPVKKAVDSSKNFIGYIYEPVQFENTDICMNFTDLQNMNNLVRLKGLIRLVTQVNSILNAGFKFIQNPFDNVFFVRGFKTKQVQIVNIDFISKKGSVKDTKAWICEYVYKVLGLDNSIEIDVNKKATDLGTLLDKMNILAEQMTKYCHNHKAYYKNTYLFCPRCVDKTTVSKIEIIEKPREYFDTQPSMTEGGEAHIYLYHNSSVAKVFKKDKFKDKIDVDFKNRILVKLIQKKAILEKIDKENHKFRYIVPKAFLLDDVSKNIYGYKMDKVEGTPICNLRDKKEIERLGFTRKDVLEILITVGEGIEALHNEANMYIGDLNGRNILFDDQKNVYFLDFDGMGIDEISPEFCTDEYIDPISKKNKQITMKDDWYSLAVQTFHYLTYTHPFNGIYTVKENGQKVMLGITDKMERRISLLGHHGIKAPAIAEDWSWMDKEFINILYEIFEKERRVSIVPYLRRQYEILYNSQYSHTDVQEEVADNNHIRINSKFIATPITTFNTEVMRMINPYTSICKNENELYVSISGNTKKWEKLNFPYCTEIQDVLLSYSEDLAFVIYRKQIDVYDLNAQSKIYTEALTLPYDESNIVVNGSTLYFLDCDQRFIFKREFVGSGFKKERLRLPSSYRTNKFYVESNSKFITVDEQKQVYCNDDFLYHFNNSDGCLFNILYDEIYKLWLVINNEGCGIIINSRTGRYKEFDLKNSIDCWNLNSITFNKGHIYIPSQDCLYVSTADNFTVKKMECYGIMTPDSTVYNIKNTGFNVQSENTLYEVSKG